MDARQLEYFVAVAEELNFTRAAERCQIVQSALSHQIARLEREHGVVLFERTSRSVRLAPAGELLLPRARAILAGLESARVDLAEFAGVITGSLRLGMLHHTATTSVDDGLALFHKRHPDVEIEVVQMGSLRMAEDVLAGDLDIAVVDLSDDQVREGLTYRLVATEPLVAVVPQSSSFPPGPTTLAALAATAFVETHAASGLRRHVDAVFSRAGVTRDVALELPGTDTVVRFVAAGFGPAIVPLSAATAASEDVAVVDLADPDALYPIGLVHRNPEPSSPSGRALLSILTLPDAVVDPIAGVPTPGQRVR
jgi:DNA-binding transcriptional LysR family regulator